MASDDENKGREMVQERKSTGQNEDTIEVSGDNSASMNNPSDVDDLDSGAATITDGNVHGQDERRTSFERAGRLASSKRKSNDISRDEAGLGGPENVDEAHRASKYNVAESQGNIKYASGDASKRQGSGPSKARKRGLSLRSSLFSKNLDKQPHADNSILEMQSVRPSSRSSPLTDAKGAATKPTSVFENLRTRLSGMLANSQTSSGSSSRKGDQRGPGLPSHRQRVQKRAMRLLPSSSAKVGYHRLRKLVLGLKDIPPSEDGRHISLDPFKKKAPVDERTGQAYMSNLIKSSKYNAWNFLPRQLFAQFSKLANCYFLFVSILQIIPGLSTTGRFTTIVPLMFFVALSMAKEGYEDLRRHRLDKAENNKEAQVLSIDSTSTIREKNDGTTCWVPVKWQALQVGDIVKLDRDDAAPADLLLLDSKGENNVAYLETMALDGETNLKTKQPSAAIAGTCRTPESITAMEHIDIVVEDPNLDLYNFEGKITVPGTETAPLTNNEVVYRGSILRNTPEVYGLVIYSGEECKIRMNANKNPRIKAPALQSVVNKIVIMMVLFVLSLAAACTIAYQVWSAEVESTMWFLDNARVNSGPIFTSFIIMFNTMIPLSLYVSLEIIKVGQLFLFHDVDMYDEKSNTPFEAHTTTINEELGQVSYIFSDKTGTLTENVMRFRCFSVAGTAWLHDADIKQSSGNTPAAAQNSDKRQGSKGRRSLHQELRNSTSNSSSPSTTASRRASEDVEALRRTPTWKSAAPNIDQPEHTTAEMISYIQRKPDTAFARAAKMMILSIALCHTCLPERRADDSVTYQASSPDELALIQAAADLGYIAISREKSTLTLQTFPDGLQADSVLEAYEILDIVEFSSERKRMSVIVRFPDGRICVICKGADSVIIERLRLLNLAQQKLAEVEHGISERRSMEARHALQRRQSSFAEARISTSVAGSRPSIGAARRSSTRDEVRGWLQQREHSSSRPSRDASLHYSPRPSAQMSRNLQARSGRSRDLQRDVVDDALVEESLVTNDAAVLERCFRHLKDFSTQGLRCLLYGYRFLEVEEYQSWKGIYQDATTSLVDRTRLVEEAGDLIEQQLELGGAIAIEDKLQEGVPETIDRLRRANIKMWMLTGDKRETAINIGHSCRLIKDFSTVTIIDSESSRVEQSITSAIVGNSEGNVAHSVIVIDGKTLGMIQAEETLHGLFLDLAILADSVICCRASPSQKASLVHSIRRHVNRSVTLAIGDGANDIAMIQEAHVGIGLTGKEGLQAARVSDYAIAQFRFLNKLLLVHGRWNYIRTAKYTLATFWKEMLFYLTQALYQRWNGYTGTSLYEQWSLSQFNTLFTSLPVIFLGIFEKDLAASTLIAVPELYTKGQRFAGFNFRVYWSWMFMAVSEAMIVFFTMRGLFGLATWTSGRDLFAMGTMTYSACVIVINIKCQMLEQHNRSIMAFACLVIEIGGWFLWNIIFNYTYNDNYEYNVRGGLVQRFGQNALWWLSLIIAASSCVLLEIVVRALKRLIWPTDVEIFQELEKDPDMRARFENESNSELAAGSSDYMAKQPIPSGGAELDEKADQARKEGEMVDMLQRPRTLEQDDTSPLKSGVKTDERLTAADGGENNASHSTDIHEMLARRFGNVKR